MPRVRYKLPQALIDQHTLIAQRYAGWFFGRPFRHQQEQIGPSAITYEGERWREPVVVEDDCEFCRRMTDEDVERRIAGYQHQLDIEVLRPHMTEYSEWLAQKVDEVPEKQAVMYNDQIYERGITGSQVNRRTFIEKYIEPRMKKIATLVAPLPMVRLPFRLKRKLCIEWNHLYRDFLAEHPEITYDFEKREFMIDLPEPKPLPCCGGDQKYAEDGTLLAQHLVGCEERPAYSWAQFMSGGGVI
jgi:hypothetical protein